MPDGFDITQPSPDSGHEAIRVAVVEALEELGYASGDLSVSLELVDVLFVLVDQALTDLADAQQQLADLTARLDALEAPPLEP